MSEHNSYTAGDFCWVDLVAHDMKSAIEFYGKVFDWEYTEYDTHGGPPYGQFGIGERSVAGIGQMSDEMKSQGISPMWNSYVLVDNVEDTIKKATELGATVTVPPMKVLEAGWLAFFQDPTGGNIGLWQPLQHKGTTLKNVPGALCWNEFATREIDKAKEFFGTLFGWEFEENPHVPSKYYIINNNGKGQGGLMQMTEEWGDTPPHWGVYFQVSDIGESLEKLQNAGGKVCVPTFEIPVGKMSVVNDPQGATFTFIQLNEGAM